MNFENTLLLLLLMMFNSCSPNNEFSKSINVNEQHFKGTISVEKIEKLGKFKISIHNTLNNKKDCIYTPYEVFQLEVADVNFDGHSDICIGIIKPTPFDSILKKRLFIFKIDQDYIRPLWLSSRLVNPLVEFKIGELDSATCIQTIESVGEDQFCINEYKWGSFGMVYLKTVKDSLLYFNVKNIFKDLP